MLNAAVWPVENQHQSISETAKSNELTSNQVGSDWQKSFAKQAQKVSQGLLRYKTHGIGSISFEGARTPF